ncbi:MAG: hypothetical protein HY908_09615 [Myxococcales bacterium]|nr:hypothetical protein [Myxococcales bacterium]
MTRDERSPSRILLRARAAAAAALATAASVLVWPATSGCADCLDELPSGSYKASCTSCQVDCTLLSCVCDGRSSELDLSSCEAGTEVWNDHGTLKCGSGGASCIKNDNACGPSDAFVAACCSGYCGPTGTCK